MPERIKRKSFINKRLYSWSRDRVRLFCFHSSLYRLTKSSHPQTNREEFVCGIIIFARKK
ncbi:hypothetical protein HMPREF1555_02132 [Porphyromonas gingivalis F0570]|uniref:Uncharacterized protein n=1 Tax=Porphyromonas gingivalis F0570 TaxID=1227271 RepID=A0A0E2LNI1_PORGN|nr:hypothetical protein HMPREF1555_02132 [Porphyromonas gingivalis F0570]